jgi:hypothetical protein
MENLSRDAFYSVWVSEASRAFRELEKKSFPASIDIIALSGEEAYLKELYRLIYLTSRLSNISDDVRISLSNFLSFLLKSTLFFDFAFIKNLREKTSKFSLMYGDLYLAQGGIEFTKIKNFLLLKDELKKTLEKIALSQKLDSSIYLPNFADYKQIVRLRFGSIFRLAIKSPLVFSNIDRVPRMLTIDYPDNVALLVTLKNNEYLKSLLSEQEKAKKIDIIRKNVENLEGRVEEWIIS